MTELSRLVKYLAWVLLGVRVRAMMAPGYPVIRPHQNTVWTDDLLFSPAYW